MAYILTLGEESGGRRAMWQRLEARRAIGPLVALPQHFTSFREHLIFTLPRVALSAQVGAMAV
jgi:hypothetical protein